MMTENWQLFTLMALVAINVLNAITPHFRQWPAVVKWLGLAVELLSVVTSKGVFLPASPSKLKAPLQSVPRRDSTIKFPTSPPRRPA